MQGEVPLELVSFLSRSAIKMLVLTTTYLIRSQLHSKGQHDQCPNMMMACNPARITHYIQHRTFFCQYKIVTKGSLCMHCLTLFKIGCSVNCLSQHMITIKTAAPGHYSSCDSAALQLTLIDTYPTHSIQTLALPSSPHPDFELKACSVHSPTSFTGPKL